MKKFIPLLITLLLSISLCACGSKQEEEVMQTNAVEEVEKTEEKLTYKSNLTVDKAEEVNVKADASGNVYETEVEVNLKNPLDGNPIQDRSNLVDIMNTEGEEEYTIDGDCLYWDNNGQDIHYKGYSSEALPVSVKIHYYLNNKEVDPSELAHASGHVKMVFDYINNTSVVSKVNGINYNVKIPFLCVTMLYLPSDNFYNVESDDGQIVSMDDSVMVIGMGFPGLQDSLKLNNTDFTKDVDLKESFEIEADVVDFELDYTATLVSNGLLKDLEDKDLKDVDEMLDEVDDIDDQKADIEDSKDDLDDASKKFTSMVDQLASYISTLNAYATDMASNSTDVDNLLDNKMTILNKELNPALDDTYTYSFVDLSDAEFKNKMKEELDYYTNISTDETKDQTIREDASTALSIAKYYYASKQMIAYSMGFASQFNASSVKSSVVDAFDELIDVLDDFEDNIDDLTKDMDSGLRETINRLKASRNVDKDYDNFSGIVDGKDGSVMFIIQTDEIK